MSPILAMKALCCNGGRTILRAFVTKQRLHGEILRLVGTEKLIFPIVP